MIEGPNVIYWQIAGFLRLEDFFLLISVLNMKPQLRIEGFFSARVIWYTYIL